MVGTLVSGELLKLGVGGDEGTVRVGRCMDSSILSPKCCLPTLLSPCIIYSLAWLLGWYAWRLFLKLLVCAPSPNRDRQTDTHTRTYTRTHTCTHTRTHPQHTSYLAFSFSLAFLASVLGGCFSNSWHASTIICSWLRSSGIRESRPWTALISHSSESTLELCIRTI